jgi:hypothetical protein
MLLRVHSVAALNLNNESWRVDLPVNRAEDRKDIPDPNTVALIVKHLL